MPSAVLLVLSVFLAAIPGESDLSRLESAKNVGLAALEEGHVLLVRHRGEYRIPDGFFSVQHLADWAKAGGRYA